ncbi:hypothetical protein D3C83_126110 [compost metagenome]
MNFEVGEVREPGQRRTIINKDVLNRRPRRLLPRDGKRFHPLWSEARRIFFVEEIGHGAIRIALQRDRPVLQVRQKPFGNL